ncbi:hypothetical protein ITJ38_03765 [Agreia pratensis]|uniref:SipW-cognate class signal peptide n=1 Tax=Agreia pratensis TaxID=150121 RepID=A0A1X7I4M3_9MICO|nr:hypothetical protein [Agreia pratensis]MBF4633517.1 hypothetical protein [Agreia pratensis]SMG09182.1 hypothetical protein SAMN06296010_0164 [Agreia pratensis]
MRGDAPRRGAARHRRVTASRAGGLRPSLPITIASALVLLLCVAGTAGTQATLQASASTSDRSVVISAGSADLSLSPLSLDTTSLYPGLTLVGPVTVTNTGNVPLQLGVAGLTMPSGSAANALSDSLVVGVRTVPSASSCTAANASPVWSGSAASAPAGSIGSTLPKSTSQILCVSVTLPINAPAESQGKSASGISLRISGTQA